GRPCAAKEEGGHKGRPYETTCSTNVGDAIPSKSAVAQFRRTTPATQVRHEQNHSRGSHRSSARSRPRPQPLPRMAGQTACAGAKRMRRARVAVLISGRGSNMSALIEAASKPEFPADIALVVSNRADAAGLARAASAGIATAVVDHRKYAGDRAAFEGAVQANLDVHGIELVCLAGFMRLLSPWFVGRWQDRLINIHPSLLPAFKGLDTHARALAAGAKIHGATVHLVV